VLASGDAIIVWLCKGERCHECKKKCVGGLPHNCFLFTMNQELQIPLDKWSTSMPQL